MNIPRSTDRCSTVDRSVLDVSREVVHRSRGVVIVSSSRVHSTRDVAV